MRCSFSSAGIGRTGVLILMETALCLMENRQAVFPFNIVQQMREQRLGMIQTAVRLPFPFRNGIDSIVPTLESISIRLRSDSLRVRPWLGRSQWQLTDTMFTCFGQIIDMVNSSIKTCCCSFFNVFCNRIMCLLLFSCFFVSQSIR
jgi:hypothetical protein